MNSPSPIIPHSAFRTSHSTRAFTMIEIAISLAVIGFALVAIIGVLPFGMDVQKQNREETIINQDATVWMNAIRSGSRGLNNLTNYVIAITNVYGDYDHLGVTSGLFTNWYTFDNSSAGYGYALTNGARIIGLLSTPKYIMEKNGDFRSNYVVAAVRAMSGPVSETFPQTNTAMQDLTFSYRLISEVIPYGTSYVSPNWTNPMFADARDRKLWKNLHEVRLLFRWPLAKGVNAQGRQLYRAMVGGLWTNDPPKDPYWYLQPQSYVQVE